MSEQQPQQSVGLPEPSKPEDARLRTRGVLIALMAIAVVLVTIGGVVIATQGNDDGDADTSGAVAAPCGAVITRPTDQTQEHTTEEDISYADAPPSFGKHFPQWEPFGRAFYTDDRPPVSHLVHNLEHGYTIAWYDEVAAADEDTVDRLEAVANAYLSDQERFLAVPWRSSDGAEFPDGMHVALTRWTADRAAPGDLARQRGNWLYCGGTDEVAIRAFVEEFPNAESPEPGIPVR